LPILENWQLINNHLYGEIHNDEKGRFPDGTPIRTSTLQEINEAEGYAQTLNTRYTLGKKLKVE
jgi:hypothetical protein